MDTRRLVPRTDQVLADPRLAAAEPPPGPGPGQGRRVPRAAAAGHCDVEFDLATGVRARRGAGALDALARAVPAAGAVAVFNNNAAALVLAATALTSPDAGEIVVSRGELIGPWSPPAATSCSAVRRPAWCSAAPTWCAG